jgi:hypothetical protein
VERHESLPSTNDEAFRRAAEGAPEGLLVITRHQSAGRGRQGRTWWDAPGDSLLASLLLRPAVPLARYPQLGMAMACAVAEAAERLVPGERFDVKWPNDVLHRGRKFCGILAETRVGHSSPAGIPLVIGFGVNVNQTAEAWPPDPADRHIASDRGRRPSARFGSTAARDPFPLRNLSLSRPGRRSFRTLERRESAVAAPGLGCRGRLGQSPRGGNGGGLHRERRHLGPRRRGDGPHARRR